MIFYFSGTGNSMHVATELAKTLGERLIAIGDAIVNGDFSFSLQEGESIGMVFPTYSWGPAPVVLNFMKQMQITGASSDTYCYMVTTCGDDVGTSVDIWRKALPQGLCGNAAFSVQMPNNYILLPGFDVDSKELERAKIARSAERIGYIAECIKTRKDMVDVVTGSWKRLKSGLIRAWFLRYAMSDKPFRVDADRCTGCGLCIRKCPVKNLKADADGRPVWQGNCAMCLGCIHHCPTRAIQYGTRTATKGRYFLSE